MTESQSLKELLIELNHNLESLIGVLESIPQVEEPVVSPELRILEQMDTRLMRIQDLLS